MSMRLQQIDSVQWLRLSSFAVRWHCGSLVWWHRLATLNVGNSARRANDVMVAQPVHHLQTHSKLVQTGQGCKLWGRRAPAAAPPRHLMSSLAVGLNLTCLVLSAGPSCLCSSSLIPGGLASLGEMREQRVCLGRWQANEYEKA